MSNISVNFKDTQKVDHILESSLDVQSFFLMYFILFINYRKSKRRYSSRLSIPMFIGTPCITTLSMNSGSERRRGARCCSKSILSLLPGFSNCLDFSPTIKLTIFSAQSCRTIKWINVFYYYQFNH